MSTPRFSPVALLLSLLAVGLVFGAVLGYADAVSGGRIMGTPATAGLAAAAAVAFILWGTIVYWRRLDEAAREAHKWAWFWGGSAGMCIGFVVLPLLLASPPGLELPAYFDRTDPPGWVATGMGLILLLMTAGYALAWGWWWLRRR
jgi:hypothetical protein